MKARKAITAILALSLISGVAYWTFYESEIPERPNEEKKKTNSNKAKYDDIEIQEGLEVCEICGYESLEKEGDKCSVCNSAITKKTIELEGVKSQRDFVIIRQIDFFMPDSYGMAVDFKNPPVTAQGFRKNAKWRPSVYESDIVDVQRKLQELERLEKDSAMAKIDSLEA